MVIKDNLDKSLEGRGEREDQIPLVSSSHADVLSPPPPFSHTPTDSEFPDPFFDLPQGDLVRVDYEAMEPPPDFAHYDADHFEVRNGDVVSHDPHLNTDGSTPS